MSGAPVGVRHKVLVSTSENPFWNLAAEEHLLNSLEERTRLLLLYTNTPAVVIGKHQNPWLEVHISKLLARGIPLLRRISGGGAVYHDTGNLNFSFLGPKQGFDRQQNLVFVREALLSLGIRAEVSGVADLSVEGKKMSGNAYCFRRDRALHHGTLLVNADLSSLAGLLSPPALPISTHAVRSNPAETANLIFFEPGLTRDSLTARLVEFFAGPAAPVGEISPENFSDAEIDALERRNRTWEWNFGRSPDFSVELGGLGVSIHKGRVASVKGGEAAGPLIDVLEGAAFRTDELARRLEEVPAELKPFIAALQAMSG